MSNIGGLIGTACYTVAALPFAVFLKSMLPECKDPWAKRFLRLYIAGLILGIMCFLYFHLECGTLIHNFNGGPMFINEYGNRNDPTIILLSPMMISGSDLYGQMSPFFQGSYHIISPDQGGHGKAGAYISADEEYQTLKDFLLETGCTDIELVYGASLGAAVAYRLFLDSAFTVRHAWLDGVALTKSAGFAEWFVSKMYRSRKKKSAKLKGRPSSMLIDMYGIDYATLMAKNFERITPEDIDAICHACCHYDLRKLTEEEQRKLHLDFGEKDFDLRYSRKTIPVYMPGAELVIRPGYKHCGYMAAHTKEYVEEIERFIERPV